MIVYGKLIKKEWGKYYVLLKNIDYGNFVCDYLNLMNLVFSLILSNICVRLILFG